MHTLSANLLGVRSDAFPALTPVVRPPRVLQSRLTTLSTLGGIGKGDRAPKGGGLSPRVMCHSHVTRSANLPGVRPGTFPALTPVVMSSRVLRSQLTTLSVLDGGGLSPVEMCQNRAIYQQVNFV